MSALLTMAQSRPLRNVILATRVTAGIVSAVSLTLFILVLGYIFSWYDTQSTDFSVLPAIALGISIVWNLAAMLTVNMMSRTSHAITDLLIFCILVTLGCIGFIHDDNYYLSNGNDSDYLNSSWLNQEIAAGGCMVATAVLQFLLVVMNLLPARKSKIMQNEETFVVVSPPPCAGPKNAEPPKSKLQLEKEEWLAKFDARNFE